MITVTTNIPTFAEKFTARSEILKAKLMAAVNDLSLKLQLAILNRAGSPASNAHRVKGWLANSIRPVPATASGNEVSGGVLGGGGDAWYGALFEYGRPGAYSIVATNAKALHFMLHGQEVYLHKVMHPGFDSGKLAFMEPVFADFHDEIISELETAATEALK